MADVTAPIDHILDLTRLQSGWWRAACSCGSYRSKPKGFPGLAESAGAAHVRAKTGGAQ